MRSKAYQKILILIFSLPFFALPFFISSVDATIAPPTYQKCEEALLIPTNNFVNYGLADYGIPGKGVIRGVDKILFFGDKQQTQCFCPQEGNMGTQSDWWNASKISLDEIAKYKNQGWMYLLPGKDGNVYKIPYLVKNRDYQCKGTPTLTPVPTSTPTKIPSVTSTVTITPTATKVPTHSVTPTNTMKPTQIPTRIPTQTPVCTATPTKIPTYTVTPTPLASHSITNTPTQTLTGTLTPTNTSTPTNTPTLTPTNSPTATFTPTVNPTNTQGPTSIPVAQCSNLALSVKEGSAPLTVTFTGYGNDPRGDIKGYEFTFGDTSNNQPNTIQQDGNSATHTYYNPGTYTAQLRIKDSTGNWRDENGDCKRTITVTSSGQVLGSTTQLPKTGVGAVTVFIIGSISTLGFLIRRKFRII